MRATLPATDALWHQSFQHDLKHQLSGFGAQSRLVLGCSGGVDSLLLLYILAEQCPVQLHVVTIDHGLQTDSTRWCQQVAGHCQHLGVSCEMVRVEVDPGGNMEQQARRARYTAFEHRLAEDDVLVLGHHRQDQAETVLLHLLRGSGVSGLTGMQTLERRHRPLGYWLWRPLLTLSRHQINHWAEQLGLQPVQDPMNADVKYDRVWCRHQVWPVLQSRFVQMESAICRTATLMQDAQAILQDVLDQDVAFCLSKPYCLNLSRLQSLSAPRQRQLLSHFLMGEQAQRPPFSMVQQLQSEVINARADAQARLLWQGWYIVRFGDHLHRIKREVWDRCHVLPESSSWVANGVGTGLRHPLASGHYTIERVAYGLHDCLLGQPLQLLPRQGGEQIRRLGRPRQSLKKALHAATIPPWLRHQVQLLCYHDHVLGVLSPAGFWLTESPYLQPNGWLPHLCESGVD